MLLFIQNISPIPIGWKHTHNSPYPATDDQIWKNDINSEASLQVNTPLTEKTLGLGWAVLVVKTKMEDISLVLRVRTRWNNS